MFMPGRDSQKEQLQKQLTYKRVEDVATKCIPAAFRDAATVSVQEVQCGDPNCAPIDTVVTLLFERYVAIITPCIRIERRA